MAHPQPVWLAKWWKEHPERYGQRDRRPRLYRGFPAHGTLRAQVAWFRQQFLKLADKASSDKERGNYLKLAFMATLKGDPTGASDDADYREHLERMLASQESRRNGGS